ncbi:MAG: hypothetical protein HY905_26560 [Deltaproteobacteria bacterium]|nr:hypothetical protein [Deltaproteobacteria bacterium]
MDAASHAEDPELPPAVVAETRSYRCEWCGRALGGAAEERDLAGDVGRKTHRYLPRKYRACDEACRAGVARFVRRHLALGPLLWSLTVMSFLVGVVALLATLPPPARLLMLEAPDLLLLLALLGILGTVTGALVTALPYTFIARRPEGDPPAVPLRRTLVLNRLMGAFMAAFSVVVVVRVLLWL